MNLADLKKLRADLGWIAADPDGKLTHVQSYHLNRAIVAVSGEVRRLQDIEELKFRTVPSLRERPSLITGS